jgi:hypothetical protein
MVQLAEAWVIGASQLALLTPALSVPVAFGVIWVTAE